MEKKYDPLTVDIKGLQSITGLGKNQALKVGVDSGARVELGIRRTLYNVEIVKAYLDSKTAKNITNEVN